MEKITKTEYDALVHHYRVLTELYLADIIERTKKAGKLSLPIWDNQEYMLCREEGNFVYRQAQKIKDILASCEVVDVALFRNK